MNQPHHLASFSGLSPFEVEQSRKQHGSNSITKKAKKGFFAHYLESFSDPIIKILLIALAVNVLFLFKHSEWYESVGIAVAVLVATLVSTVSEYGSEAAFEKLQQEAGILRCRVRRGGMAHELPSNEIVVGDIVLLQSGERVPADGRIILGELHVDQSPLNGETREAYKFPDGHDGVLDMGLNSSSALFRGSVVCMGEGEMLVERVGDATFYGGLALEVQEEKAESPLRRRLQSLAGTISRFGYAAAVIVAIAAMFNSIVIDSDFVPWVMLSRITNFRFMFGSVLNALTLGITVIVMAVPEGLPMMITVVLSSNMRRMLKDNVLVRKLVGVETSGSMNILFTDKTGTLTKGSLEVTKFLSGGGGLYEGTRAIKASKILFPMVLRGCMGNTDSQISSDGKSSTAIGGNSTDRALLTFAIPHANFAGEMEVLEHTPFNSKDKYSFSRVRCGGRELSLVKGAPERLLPLCKNFYDDRGIRQPFSPGTLNRAMGEMASSAIRMLALCETESRLQPGRLSAPMTLVGILGIRDEVRPDSREAVRQIKAAGIQIVMITGDNRETAVAVARETGLITDSEVPHAAITSEELASMPDKDVKARLAKLRVVSRALPSDKSRLVRLAQELGLVAGMTGDGINDAPALKKADVGFAMGSGTEVAKEAGDIVILDNRISSIAKAILYGRTIFKSIRKFIVFQLTMNLCAVSLSVICPFLGVDAPLTIMQMLWVNMIMDTLAGLAFSGEAPLSAYMREPPKHRDDRIINRYMYSQILFAGIYTTALCILFLKLPVFREIFRYGDGTDYFMTGFFSLFIFTGIFNGLNARTNRINLTAHLLSNRGYIVVMVFICAVQLLLIYKGGHLFRTMGVSVKGLQIILIMAFSVIPADIIRKLGLRAAGRFGHI